MLQIQIPLTEEEIQDLKDLEKRGDVHVDKLLREYLAYLLEGGSPVTRDYPTSEEFTRIAADGGSFDWLRDEPDLYSLEDGEPI